MRMIAERAGISVGGLYLYFKGKEELCLTMLKDRFNDLVAELEKVALKIQDPADAFTQFITVSVEYTKRHRELILAQGREQGFTFGIDVKKRFFKNQRRLVEMIIRKGIDSGHFDDCNVREAAKIVTSMIRGFVLSIVVDPENLFQPDECARFMLRGLLRRKEQ